jgi:hypothetical protein
MPGVLQINPTVLFVLQSHYRNSRVTDLTDYTSRVIAFLQPRDHRILRLTHPHTRTPFSSTTPPLRFMPSDITPLRADDLPKAQR